VHIWANMRLFVTICIHIWANMYLFVTVCMHIWANMRLFVTVCMHIWANMYLFVTVCMHIWANMYVFRNLGEPLRRVAPRVGLSAPSPSPLSRLGGSATIPLASWRKPCGYDGGHQSAAKPRKREGYVGLPPKGRQYQARREA
jgi:hypothetical protein